MLNALHTRRRRREPRYRRRVGRRRRRISRRLAAVAERACAPRLGEGEGDGRGGRRDGGDRRRRRDDSLRRRDGLRLLHLARALAAEWRRASSRAERPPDSMRAAEQEREMQKSVKEMKLAAVDMRRLAHVRRHLMRRAPGRGWGGLGRGRERGPQARATARRRWQSQGGRKYGARDVLVRCLCDRSDARRGACALRGSGKSYYLQIGLLQRVVVRAPREPHRQPRDERGDDTHTDERGALGVGRRVEPQRRADGRRPVRLGPDRRVAVDDAPRARLALDSRRVRLVQQRRRLAAAAVGARGARERAVEQAERKLDGRGDGAHVHRRVPRREPAAVEAEFGGERARGGRRRASAAAGGGGGAPRGGGSRQPSSSSTSVQFGAGVPSPPARPTTRARRCRRRRTRGPRRASRPYRSASRSGRRLRRYQNRRARRRRRRPRRRAPSRARRQPERARGGAHVQRRRA